MGVEEEGRSIVLEGRGDLRSISNSNRLEKRQALPGISFAVTIILITMKLCDIDQTLSMKLAGKVQVCIDENPHPEDAVAEGGKKLPGFFRGAIALALGPEIDAESGYSHSGEFISVIRGGHSANLQGGSVGGKKAVQESQHGLMMEIEG